MKILKTIGAVFLACTLALAIPVQSMASVTKTITLAWNHNGADLNKFKLYYGTTEGGPYTNTVEIFPADLSAGTFQTSEIIIVPDNTTATYYFTVTALDSEGNESGYSNEVFYTIDFESPDAPFQLIIKIVTGDPIDG